MCVFTETNFAILNLCFENLGLRISHFKFDQGILDFHHEMIKGNPDSLKQ